MSKLSSNNTSQNNGYKTNQNLERLGKLSERLNNIQVKLIFI